MLIDTFINSVYLYDDRIVLTFNSKESAKSITLADIDNSFGGSDLTAGVVPIALRMSNPNKGCRVILCPLFHLGG